MRHIGLATVVGLGMVLTFLAPARAITTTGPTVMTVVVNTIHTGAGTDTTISLNQGPNYTFSPTGDMLFDPGLTVGDPSIPTDPNLPGSHTSWLFDGQHDTGLVIRPTTGQQLENFSVDLYGGQHSGEAQVYWLGTKGTYWLGTVGASATSTASSWQTVSISGSVLTWGEYNAAGNGIAGDSGTMAQFIARHGEAPGGYRASIVFGPDWYPRYGATRFALQNVRFGTSSSVTAYDLETLHNTLETSVGHWITIGQGDGASGSAAYHAGPTAYLYAKPWGATSFTQVGSLFTGSGDPLNLIAEVGAPNGEVWWNDWFGWRYDRVNELIEHPTHNTLYRWFYPATAGVSAAWSPFALTHVAAAFSKVTWPTSLTAGHTFVLRGSMSPPQPGNRVTIYGKPGYGRGTYVLGSGVESSTGAYTILGRAPVVGYGTVWSIFLQVPPYRGNEAARSRVPNYLF